MTGNLVKKAKAGKTRAEQNPHYGRKMAKLQKTLVYGAAVVTFSVLLFLITYILEVVPIAIYIMRKIWYTKRMIIKNERKSYASDLTDSQWAEIKELFPKAGNKSKWEKRELVNAVLYLVENGCKWRDLPHDFPPHTTVSNLYYAAIKSGLWEKIRAALVEKVRLNAGRTAEPSYGIIDSQSVKTTGASDERGIDGEKNEKAKAPHSSRHYGESACSCGSCCQHSRHKIGNPRGCRQ